MLTLRQLQKTPLSFVLSFPAACEHLSSEKRVLSHPSQAPEELVLRVLVLLVQKQKLIASSASGWFEEVPNVSDVVLGRSGMIFLKSRVGGGVDVSEAVLGCFGANMKSLSNLGLGLSLVFGLLFLALIAELYYLLWWKRRISNTEIEDDYSHSPKHLLYLLCWKKLPSPLSAAALNAHPPDDQDHSANGHDPHIHQSHDDDMSFLLKPIAGEGVDAEIMRLQGMCGPPRFLFTIKEETKEDMESDDGRSKGDCRSKKGSRSRSLSDVLLPVETPFLTPLSSPPFLTPPLTPVDCFYQQHGFNPLFDSPTEVELCGRTRFPSPPPKLKFLKDAEEKVQRKTVVEGALKSARYDGSAEGSSAVAPIEGDGSFITIIIGKSKEREVGQHQQQQAKKWVILSINRLYQATDGVVLSANYFSQLFK
ncbi:hypothetical protein ACLOJK_028177 [Asimina triloba]